MKRKNKYSELLTDPTVDTVADEPRSGQTIDPRLLNAVKQVLSLQDEKNRLEGLENVTSWTDGYVAFLRNEIYSVQEKLAKPELRGERETAEFLSGVLKGLLTGVQRVTRDIELLREAEKAEFHGVRRKKRQQES